LSLCNGIRIFKIIGLIDTHLFAKVPRSRDSELERRNAFGFRVKLPPHLLLPVYPLIGRGIPLSVFPKDKTSELAGLSSHYPYFMLNVKKGSCEYQLCKSLV